MKYFFIVDDSGNAIYFNHPGGMMIALPFATAQNYAKENFNDSFTSIDCQDGTKLAFDKWGDSLSMLVVSDEGENEAFLRSQLSLARELLFLEYSPQLLTDKMKIISGHFQKPAIIHRMTTIIDTMCFMCSQKQSFLVQSIEELLGHSISGEVKDSALSILKTHLGLFPTMHHALLFVGTKLLAEFKRPKSMHLSSKDIFLLTLFYSSHFNPKVLRRVQAILEAQQMLEAAETPDDIDFFVAETQRNREQQLTAKYQLEEIRDMYQFGIQVGFEGIFIEIVQLALKTIGQYRGKLDGCFSEDVKKCIQHVQLQHGKQPADGELTIEFFRLLADLVSRAHQHSLDSKSSEMDTSPPKATLVGPPGVEATSDVAVAIEVLQLVIKMITEQFQSVPTQLSPPGSPLNNPSEKPSPAITPNRNSLASPTSPQLAFDPIDDAEAVYHSTRKLSISSMEDILSAPSTPTRDYEDTNSSKSSPGMRSKSGRDIRSRYQDRLKSLSTPPVERIYQQVYLSSNQYNPLSLYCAKLHERVTLVIVTSNTQTSEAERKDLLKVEAAIKESILENYIGYLLSMENSYTMISYMHQLPGLVHFIFVDRTSNRILAPGITSLIGNASKFNTKMGNERALSTLKSYIWQLCYQSYEFLSRGNFDMMMKYGDFQFSYKLWFEDSNGAKLPLPTSNENEDSPKDSHSSDSTSRDGSPMRSRKPISHIPHHLFNQREAITREFYKRIQKSLFPEQKDVKMLELFCLYTGGISLKFIEQYNNNLIEMLTERL